MISANQQTTETTSRKEFTHSLDILAGIASWHVWSGVLMTLLLPGTIILLSFPLLFAQFSLFQKLDASLLARGSLGMMWVVSAFTLYHQRRRLKLLRKGLIEQTDAATKNRVKAEQFYGLSILDPLTGLYNRRFGEARLDEEITRAKGLDKSDKSGDSLLLLALDFDRFKEINDKYGHAAGDLALKEFSRRLQRAIRACDVPIRVGGDEFLVILPECPSDKIKPILSRIGSVALNLDGKQISVSFSHGMSQYQVNDTPETMIRRADERLYDAKARRKAEVGNDQASTTKSVAPKASEHPSVEPLGFQQVARMRSESVRRSGRIPKEISIVLIGHDLEGKVFSEQTNTVELSRHGAGVVSRHKLAPDQEIIVRRLDTKKEAEARVVRVVRSQSDSFIYGLTFTNSDHAFWGVEFPPLTESEKEASHSLFECRSCKARETIDNSDLGSQDCAVNNGVARSCQRCGSVTTWERVLGDDLSDDVSTSVAEEPQVLS